MDIFNFIGSRDIRRYLKEIQYKFNGLESRGLSTSLKQRHWQIGMLPGGESLIPCEII